MDSITRHIVVSLALLLLCLDSGCKREDLPRTVESSPPAVSVETPLPPVELSASLVRSINDFSMKLYLAVADDQEGNLALSPLGSYTLLTLLHEGSAGETREEIESAVGASQPKQLGDLLKNLDERDSVVIDQRLFFQDKLKASDDYLAKIADISEDPVEYLPFKTAPSAATETINEWVAKTSSGLFEELLHPLNADTQALLLAFMHYEGQWVHPFPAGQTEAEFFRAGDLMVVVPMMSVDTEKLATFPVKQGKGIALPYHNQLEMLLLLPEEGVTVDQFVSGFELQDLPKLEPTDSVRVQLPRFAFETSKPDLENAWKQIGLEKVLSEPDLSKMFETAPDSLHLDVMQKTYIRVNEEGTEVTSASVSTAQTAAAEVDPPETIRFDRPFFFILRHAPTGAVVMLGKVERPEEVAGQPREARILNQPRQ
jgi:serpin B